MNANGTAQTRLTDNEADDVFPKWSPDGQKITFHSLRDGNWEIYVMNADGSNVIRLTENPADDGYADWSPIIPTEAWTAPLAETAADTRVDAPISAEDLARAEEAFAAGALVYLFEPQPVIVSTSDLLTTQFSVRYLLSENARPVDYMLYARKVNVQGDEEYVMSLEGSVDWTSEIGELTFMAFDLLSILVPESIENPAFRALVADRNAQRVDDPVYVDVFLLAAEERDGGLSVSNPPKFLSNVARIPVGPITATPQPDAGASPTPSVRPPTPSATPTPLVDRLATEPPAPTVSAQPTLSTACQNELARFTAPSPGAEINGVVPIQGTANIADFLFYKVQFLPDKLYPDGAWGELYQSDTPVVDGTLMTWHTYTVGPGVYWLRLLVHQRNGNYPPPCELRLVVTP